MRLALVLFMLATLASPLRAQDASLVAITMTPTNDGVLTVPLGGNAAFAVAGVNIGPAAADIDVSVNLIPNWFPLVTAVVCQTDPTSGQCISPPSGSTSVYPWKTGEVKTFSVFVTALQAVPFVPGGIRIFVLFDAREAPRPHAYLPAPYAAVSVSVRAP
jgi:hypothetical protein